MEEKFPFIECHEIDWSHMSVPLKPLILLYPQKEMDIDISLNYSPGFSATFPEYGTKKQGWSVVATPESIIKDKGTGMETYGLFWEGKEMNQDHFDLSRGFVIKGSEIREFLYEKLREMGLTTKEYSDFIMFWYPKLQEYPYIQITFAGNDYTDTAKLTITPTPDSMLRVFMVAKPLSEYKEVPPQKIEKFERKGFSVVEWGGTILE